MSKGTVQPGEEAKWYITRMQLNHLCTFWNAARKEWGVFEQATAFVDQVYPMPLDGYWLYKDSLRVCAECGATVSRVTDDGLCKLCA